MPKKKSVSLKQSKFEQKSPQKSVAILALQRPSPPPVVEKTVLEEVSSPVVIAQEPVIVDSVSDPPLTEKSSNSIDSLSAVDSVPESNDLVPKSNDALLIGTFIEVLAPWGGKVLVEIVDTYFAPSGSKWVSFNAVDEIPEGWMWEGGVKLINSITI